MPDHIHDPSAIHAIFKTCWDLLDEAAAGTGAGWRLPIPATRTTDGCRQRTVVLRGVDRHRSSLLFHTDVRSAKIEQLRSQPSVALLFFDPQLEVQLQIQGVAMIHTDDAIADRLWEASTTTSLKMYLAPLAPGTQRSTPDFNLPEAMLGQSNYLDAASSSGCEVGNSP